MEPTRGLAAPRSHLAPIPNLPLRGGPDDPDIMDHLQQPAFQPTLGPPKLPPLPSGPKWPPEGDAGSAVVLPDVGLAGFTWYVPVFQLVAPPPGIAVPHSPFSYSFIVSGHDEHGAPVIDATITLTVQAMLTDQVRAQIPPLNQADPVVPDILQFSLLVPFRDATTGNLTSTAVAAASITTTMDSYIVVFVVHGDFARAAYGSLSRPGYQSADTQLLLQYSFTAYQSLGRLWSSQWSPRLGNPDLRPLPPVIDGRIDDRSQLATTAITRSGLFTTPTSEPAHASLIREAAGKSQIHFDPNNPILVPDPGDGDPIPLVPIEQWRAVPVTRTQSLDVLVPCVSNGQLYVDSTDPAQLVAVGCQDAIALGQLPNRLYTPVDILGTDDYQVLASLSRPAVYLLLPHRYRVGRAAPGHPGVQDWSPLIRWVQEFDATHDTALPCRLQANLQPDVRPADMVSLTTALATRTPNPTLLLPTSFGSGVTAFTVTEWNTSNPIHTTLDGDTMQLSVDLNYADAVILNGMLTSAAPENLLVGNGTFALSDGSTLGPVELHVDISRLTGPWPAGPVLVMPAGAATVVITNNAENQAAVKQVQASLSDGSSQVVANNLNLTLLPGESTTVPVTATTAAAGRLVAVYTLAESTAAIVNQERIYIEDLHTTITVINDANMAAAGITSADISVRLDSDAQSFSFTFTPTIPLFQFDLVQPLVANRQTAADLLHVTATVHKDGRPDTTSSGYVADLHKGVLVQLSAVLAAP